MGLQAGCTDAVQREVLFSQISSTNKRSGLINRPRAKLVAFLTRFEGGFQRAEFTPRLPRTALDVGGPCVEAFGW
jgi:hypothetical protein